MMRKVILLFLRLFLGMVTLAVIWFVFDNIHDRNTEIILSAIGLLYSFIFLISRRIQYFGLTIFSFFGRTVSYVQRIPYDSVMREEAEIDRGPALSFVNVLFSALIELLCVFRLFASLLGHGWEAFSFPLRSAAQSAHVDALLGRLLAQ